MKKNLTVKTVDQLTVLLGLVAEASVKEAMSEMSDEKRLQSKVSDELEDFRAPEDSEEKEDLDDEEVEEAEDEPEAADKDAKKPQAVIKLKKDLTKLGSANPTPEKPSIPSAEEVMGADLGSVIKNLNKLRSGKSLKDEMTKRELNDYLKSLSSGERQSLYVFLDGLSQIMAGGVSGKEAPDPGAVGITINATAKIKKPKQAQSPSQSAPADGETKSSAEPVSTEEPKPIIVGEVAKKDEIRKTIYRLMKN